MSGDFEQWLCAQLTALKVDTDVFSSYIEGILKGDESHAEKAEAIEGILGDACPDETVVSSTTNEILSRFAQTFKQDLSDDNGIKEPSAGSGFAFDDQVKSILLQQTAKAAETAGRKKAKSVSEDGDVKLLKSSILHQYAEVEVEVEDDVADDSVIKGGDPKDLTKAKKTESAGPSAARKAPPPKVDPLLMKNTNAQAVLDAEKLKREKSKQEADAKKAKDKLDRETQRRKEAERKEKEKQRTQKAERRR